MNPTSSARAPFNTSQVPPGTRLPAADPVQGAHDTGRSQISRRTLAKGAAWSVPTIAMGVAAPAYAASTDTFAATVCYLFYPKGTNVNFQGMQMFLGVSSTTEAIPRGTEFTWTVTTSGTGGNVVPGLNYSQQNRWSLSVTPATGTGAPSFSVLLKVLVDGVTLSELNCKASLIWNDTNRITGGRTVSVVGTTRLSGSNQGREGTSALSFRVAKRYATTQPGTLPHVYLSKSDLQTCYPEIKYELTANSTLTGCGTNANDTSTTYPDGSCEKIAATTTDIGKQFVLPAKC
ncbi:hypothetical protein [Kocuria rhizophila]|uniref:hypothetical protein n=1 Tax=Kocuria rhizophila TaxID=72000 RepID=UPI0011A617FB|nr:hypothetical protein [Kocuria rhizophila]